MVLTVWESLDGGLALSVSSKYKRTFALPVLASKVRSLLIYFFFGILSCAFSNLSAAFSAFFKGFSSSGSARSSSVNVSLDTFPAGRNGLLLFLLIKYLLILSHFSWLSGHNTVEFRIFWEFISKG